MAHQADHGQVNPDLVETLREEAKRLLEATPKCHDWDHTERVTRLALQLAEAEGADITIVECAALLHDIGRAAEFADEGASCHAGMGAEQVPDILQSVGIDDAAFIDHVSACVRTHRYRKMEQQPPESIEARVVFDADKLDSMGAIGVGRAFHFAGRIGARVHNTKDEALGGSGYSHEDSAYREYLVKLRHLSESLQTSEGRRMAEERSHYMADFFRRLNEECGIPPP